MNRRCAAFPIRGRTHRRFCLCAVFARVVVCIFITEQSLRLGFSQSTMPPPFTQRRLPHGDARERVDYTRETVVLRRVCTDFAPRVGACAACHAREGIGGRNAKPTAQTKSAADPRPSRRQRRRRPTRGYVGTSNPHFCGVEEAGDQWSPLHGQGRQVVKYCEFRREKIACVR